MFQLFVTFYDQLQKTQSILIKHTIINDNDQPIELKNLNSKSLV